VEEDGCGAALVTAMASDLSLDDAISVVLARTASAPMSAVDSVFSSMAAGSTK
jgi:predicted nucleic acid-binding protein